MTLQKYAVHNVMHQDIYDCIETPLGHPSKNGPQHYQASNGTSHPYSGATSTGTEKQLSAEYGESSSSSSSENDEEEQDHSRRRKNNNDRRSNAFEKFEISPFDEHCPQHNNHNNRPSNENLLGTAFCTFMSFALIQTVVAVFARSEAMMGDSAAMIVDALTYLFNYVAENKKNQFEQLQFADCADNNQQDVDPEKQQRIVTRTKRKLVLQLELIPPLISVSVLLVVTAIVLHHAIKVLILDSHRSTSLQGNPNINIMIFFSIVNLLLDIVNVVNFAKAKHLFGYETDEHAHRHHHHILHESCDLSENDETSDNQNHQSSPRPCCSTDGDDDDDVSEEGDEEQDQHANLNMCSAYTVSKVVQVILYLLSETAGDRICLKIIICLRNICI
jgi:Co/Zn/Cd efflux system component